jgi:tetratricopeptide (TPR) repeat protein
MGPTPCPESVADCPPDVHELLVGGQRLEFAGAPARALGVYRTAEALADTPELRAEAIRRVGDAHRARGRWAEALDAYGRSLTIADGIGHDALAAEALNAIGSVSVLRGDVDEATATFEAALRRKPGPHVEGLLRQNLGMCALGRADRGRALALFEEALACFRTSGYRRGEVMALNNLGALQVELGNPGDALPQLRAAGRIARELTDLDLLLLTVCNESEAFLKLGHVDEAEQHLQEAIGHFSSAGNERRLAECLAVLGDVHRARGEDGCLAVAARCYRRAQALAAAAGDTSLAERARASLSALGERAG